MVCGVSENFLVCSLCAKERLIELFVSDRRVLFVRKCCVFYLFFRHFRQFFPIRFSNYGHKGSIWLLLVYFAVEQQRDRHLRFFHCNIALLK